MSDEIDRVIRRDIDRLPLLPADRWVPPRRPGTSIGLRVLQAAALVAALVLAVALGAALASVRSETAPGGVAAPGQATSTCGGAGLELARTYGADARLAAAFASTVADVASSYQLHEAAPAAPAPLAPVAVCFYDGHFTVMKGAPGASGVPAYDRVEIVVWPDNQAQLRAAGYQTNLPRVGPATGPSGARPTAPASGTPGRPTGTPARDATRVSDDVGGWAIEMPNSWFEQPAAQHGREFRSYDPKGLDFSGNMPPAGGVLVRMQMQQNPDKLDPAAFIASELRPRSGYEVRQHETTVVAGQPAEFLVTWQSQPSDWQALEPTFTWYVRSPFFDDRMVVIHAYPTESPLRATVERMVSTLQFYRPLAVPLTALVTREQAITNAIGGVQQNVGATIRRVEAKLVLYKEFEQAGGGGHSFATDPDMLVWVVAYEGSALYCGMGGLTPMPECHAAFSVQPARPPDQVGVFGSGASWPAWFDQLADRDR